jgi:hypothetical protein
MRSASSSCDPGIGRPHSSLLLSRIQRLPVEGLKRDEGMRSSPQMMAML